MGKSARRTAVASKLGALAFIALMSIPAIAQQLVPTPPTTLPVFDIVSIHPHNTVDENISFMSRPGIYSASNACLKDLIAYAWNVRDDLIAGLPGWAGTNRFDITAKDSDFDASAYKKLTNDQHEAMLRPVLIDRFQVKAHTEIKTLPVFDLVLTKDDPKFKNSPPPPVNDPDHPIPEGQPGRGSTRIENYALTATAVPISTLTDFLASQLNRTVIDKTGLTGVYDLKLKWTPDRLLNAAANDGTVDRPPDLFIALKEQLGLKLESAKGPVKTLVVDHAEKPSPN